MKEIKFSITIPTYKSCYLKEAILSCIEQTYLNFEIIIVNDSSPENIDSIINEFTDDRIRYYKNDKNCGAINVVDNWNICLKYAEGDYVICMGDDDRLLPNCLEEYAKLIKKYPNIGLLHGWTEIIDENSKISDITTHRCEYETAISLAWHRWNAYSLQFIGDFCFNREWIKQNGGFFKLPLAWASDDISAIIGAMKNGVANTQTPVFQYRINRHTISKTGNPDIKMQAILKEEKWYDSFLSSKPKDSLDCLYAKQMISEKEKRYQKKKGMLIAQDLKGSYFKIFRWFFKRKKYKIQNSTILYAFLQSIKLK